MDSPSKSTRALINDFQVLIANNQNTLLIRCKNKSLSKTYEASYNHQNLNINIRTLFDSTQQLYEYLEKFINDRTKFFVTQGGNINFQCIVGQKYKTMTLQTAQVYDPQYQIRKPHNFQSNQDPQETKLQDQMLKNEVAQLKAQMKQLRHQLIQLFQEERQNNQSKLNDMWNQFKRDSRKQQDKMKAMVDLSKEQILNYVAKRGQPNSFGNYPGLKPFNPFKDLSYSGSSDTQFQEELKNVEKAAFEAKKQIQDEKIKHSELEEQFNIINKRLDRQKKKNLFFFKNLQYLYPMINAERISTSINFETPYFQQNFNYDSQNKIIFSQGFNGRSYQLVGQQALPQKGKFYFEMVVERVTMSSLYIGVIREKGKNLKSIMELPRPSQRSIAIAYCSDGFVLNKGGISQKRHGDNMMKRDKVTVMIDRSEQQISWFINNGFQTSVSLSPQFMQEKIFIYIQSASMQNEFRILSKHEIYVKNNEIQI